MTNNYLGDKLIQELLADPVNFNKHGKAYQLLQEYFDTLSLDTLRPLLLNDDRFVRRAAVWVTSELGIEASSLIQNAIPLVNDGDRYIEYHALEIVMVCSVGENVEEFVHVVHSLLSNDDVIRSLCMRLVANANVSQLKAAIHFFEDENLDSSGTLHRQGLSNLVKLESLDSEEVLSLIADIDPLTRKYGVIAAKKLVHKFPELIKQASTSEDPDIRKFSQE